MDEFREYKVILQTENRASLGVRLQMALIEYDGICVTSYKDGEDLMVFTLRFSTKVKQEGFIRHVRHIFDIIEPIEFRDTLRISSEFLQAVHDLKTSLLNLATVWKRNDARLIFSHLLHKYPFDKELDIDLLVEDVNVWEDNLGKKSEFVRPISGLLD